MSLRRPKRARKDSSGSGEGTSWRVSKDLFVKSRLSFMQHEFWVNRADYPQFWDFVLRTDDGHSITCSKKDLAMFSEYFMRMFCNEGFQEATSSELLLTEASGDDLEVLLSLHYSREKAALTHLNVCDVYVLATRLQFHAAVDVCEKLMLDNLNPINVVDFLGLKYAVGTYGPSYAEPFLKYAATNRTLMEDPERLSNLPVEVLSHLLQRNDLCVSSESEVFKIIKAWCTKSNSPFESCCEEVETAIPEELWKCVRLDVADQKALSELMGDAALTSSQSKEVAQAAMALSCRQSSGHIYPSSRTTFAFTCRLMPPLAQPSLLRRSETEKERQVHWVVKMTHGEHSWNLGIGWDLNIIRASFQIGLQDVDKPQVYPNPEEPVKLTLLCQYSADYDIWAPVWAEGFTEDDDFEYILLSHNNVIPLPGSRALVEAAAFEVQIAFTASSLESLIKMSRHDNAVMGS
eukprot:jgi/Botrbrau1/21988/Bobra.0024s0005.1